MAQTCTTQSITLATGEQFVLPAGATLLGADIPGNFTSTCALPTFETLACYCFQIVFTEEGGATTPVFKGDNVTVHGLYLADSSSLYPFTAPLEGVSVINADIINTLYNTPTLGAMIKDVCVTYDEDGGGDRGQVLTVCFKTLPSIGTKLMMKASTSALLSPDFEAYYYLPAIPYEDVTSNKCGCDEV